MVREFLEGFSHGGQYLNDKKEKSKISTAPQPREIHWRLAWLMYISPDFQTPPARAAFSLSGAAQTVRIPALLAEILPPFAESIGGIFPEPLSASEELGYAVFTNAGVGVQAAEALIVAVEKYFGATGAGEFMYIEMELSECCGTVTAPAAAVKRKILLNKGFDGGERGAAAAGEPEDIIELESEIAF